MPASKVCWKKKLLEEETSQLKANMLKMLGTCGAYRPISRSEVRPSRFLLPLATIRSNSLSPHLWTVWPELKSMSPFMLKCVFRKRLQVLGHQHLTSEVMNSGNGCSHREYSSPVWKLFTIFLTCLSSPHVEIRRWVTLVKAFQHKTINVLQ